MGTINITDISDGTTADADDVNSRLDIIADEFNGNIDNDNIKSAAAIDGSKLADDSVSGSKLSLAWQDWTPTWTNLTEGNGTTDYSRYTQIGDTVIFMYSFTFGSTSSIDASHPSFTLPVTASSSIPADSANENPTAMIIGQCKYNDHGSERYFGNLDLESTTEATINLWNAAATDLRVAAVTSTAPFTWTTGDAIILNGMYEAA